MEAPGSLAAGAADAEAGGPASATPSHPALHHPPPLHRPPSGAPGGRLSVGGNRNTATVPTTSAPSAAEERFSLVTGNPLDFAMVIRLAPDLVDEIKRVEAQGGTARIKFDSSANNPSGNVDVGGKDYRFTWSREMGDLCDTYEERQSGEDGNGLLVESGCAWRKLNVQRILDESTKNHVKMRSEEAERKLKSRKAIILDHGNPSMKSQKKALVAAESNMWRKPFKQKEPEPKKRKIETPPVAVGGPPKAAYKSGLPSTTPAKSRPSVSPVPSPPEHPDAPASPFGTGNPPTKGHTSMEDIMPIMAMGKEIATSSKKEMPNRTTSGALREKSGHKGYFRGQPMDLQSMLISLLMEKPEGMSLKALERAIGDTKPNSIRKIEPIIKKIANFQAPGRYCLKSGLELENFKKSLSESRSSPEDNHHQTLALEDKRGDIPVHMPDLEEKVATEELGKQAHKQGSDEDVDIMSDDDKESKPKLQTSEPGFSASPIPWRTSVLGPIQNGPGEKQDVNGPDVVEIEQDLPDNDQDTEMAVAANSISNKEGEKPVENIRLCSPFHQGHQDSEVYTGNLFSERETIAKGGFKHKKTDSSERTYKGKSKRGSDLEHLREKSENSKRLKAGSLPQPQMSRGRGPLFLESPQNPSDRAVEDPYKGHSAQMTNRVSRDGNADSGLQKGPNQRSTGKSILGSQDSGRKPVDLNARIKAPDAAERPDINAENLGRGIRYSEKNHHSHDGLSAQNDEVSRQIQDEDCYTKERRIPRTSKEGAFGEKHSLHFDSYSYGKHGALDGTSKEAGEVSNSRTHYSPKDNNRIDVERSPVINGRGKILQRELSDLELGELRESLPEETPGAKEFERTSSFKQLENKPSTSDYWNADLSKGKPTGKAILDSGKPSPPHLRVGVPSNPEGSSKRRTPEHHAEDLTRQHHRVVQSQAQCPHPPSRADRPEVGTQKLGDVSGKLRHNDARPSQGIGLEGYVDTHKKASVNASLQNDTKRGPVCHPAKESKMQKSNASADLNDVRKDTSLTESNEGVLKRRESSSDENSCSYSKYEKEEPELRGPIKDFSQYKEYLQEYDEKYDSYSSLNKTLESYRNEFNKLGRDLEIANGKDMEKYYSILGQLKESYRQCGTVQHIGYGKSLTLG
ncbi:dentin sialophosphoprotein-like protein [Actinidia rufa]|uniref:Dentin sialophosphoprotein-like protein n=1 Tax=Actinidia rufa TaxID=165716 RepID=A0A7J0FEV6_9ERIC|nr:dentin sialophosphoprotein-like protein [Actinidia rufa]